MPLRQLLEKHRESRGLRVCHAPMDPLGFALENFDAVGRWRPSTRDSDRRIGGPSRWHRLRRRPPASARYAALAPERLPPTVAERLLTYALGRDWSITTRPAVRQIVRERRTRRLSLVGLHPGDRQERAVQMRTAAQSEDELTNASRSCREGYDDPQEGNPSADVPARHRRHPGAAAAGRDGAGVRRALRSR